MHGNRRSFLGLGLAAAALALTAMPMPRAEAAIGGADVHSITGEARLLITGVSPEVDGVYELRNVIAEPLHEQAFVDGVYTCPGCEQLRVFYRDKVYKPKHAAMQPDNGAGQVSGDKAQSVGKAGDLKAGRPGGVQSGSPTPGAKTIDAGKSTSWLRRVGPWLFGPTHPA